MKVQSCGFFEKFFCVVKNFFCVAKKFFLGFYWLKTVGKSSASTPCNQKIGFPTGTWKLKKIQIRPKKSKKIEKNPKNFFSLFYGLWGLKSSGIARAFIFCDKTSRFLAILAFSHRGRYFFQLFCYFTQSMACDSSNRSELRGRSSRTIKFHDFWLFPIFT